MRGRERPVQHLATLPPRCLVREGRQSGVLPVVLLPRLGRSGRSLRLQPHQRRRVPRRRRGLDGGHLRVPPEHCRDERWRYWLYCPCQLRPQDLVRSPHDLVRCGERLSQHRTDARGLYSLPRVPSALLSRAAQRPDRTLRCPDQHCPRHAHRAWTDPRRPRHGPYHRREWASQALAHRAPAPGAFIHQSCFISLDCSVSWVHS